MDNAICTQQYTDEQAEVIERTERYVRETLEKDSSGHDWWHIHRVRNNALHIVQEEKEGCSRYVVELAALLHDIADWKFHQGDAKIGSKTARQWLETQHVDEAEIEQICDIIDSSSYKGAGVADKMATLEGKIVQDADRLDAIGAIGIARTFAYGGHANRAMYDPDVKPTMHASFEEYKNSKGHTVNHFYEKLLLLKDRLHTDAARRIAQKRHVVMEQFLEQFFAEWDGRM